MQHEDKVVRADLTEKVTSGQRPKGSEGFKAVVIWAAMYQDRAQPVQRCQGGTMSGGFEEQPGGLWGWNRVS